MFNIGVLTLRLGAKQPSNILYFSKQIEPCTTNIRRTFGSVTDFARRKFNERKRLKARLHPKTNHDGFKLIYKLPSIRTVAFLSRLKLYQTAFVVVLAPVFIHGYLHGDLSEADIPIGGLKTITAASFISLSSLFYFSYVTRRLVFYVWLNEETNSVKLSYLNFYANRKDIVLSLDKIDHIERPNRELLAPLLKLGVVGERQFYFMSVRYGEVLEPNLFQVVFGGATLQAYLGSKTKKNSNQNEVKK